MSHTVAELRAASDEELIRLHDQAAVNTFVGVSYFLEELQRRDFVRASESSERLARAAVRLSMVSAVASVAAVILAAVALFK